jgi:hypothetical protein
VDNHPGYRKTAAGEVIAAIRIPVAPGAIRDLQSLETFRPGHLTVIAPSS